MAIHVTCVTYRSMRYQIMMLTRQETQKVENDNSEGLIEFSSVDRWFCCRVPYDKPCRRL